MKSLLTGFSFMYLHPQTERAQDNHERRCATKLELSLLPEREAS